MFHRPPIDVCVKCWHDVLDGFDMRHQALGDPRRMIVRYNDQLIVHRRIMIDPHVAGAACGDLYTHPAVVSLGTGA